MWWALGCKGLWECVREAPDMLGQVMKDRQWEVVGEEFETMGTARARVKAENKGCSKNTKYFNMTNVQGYGWDISRGNITLIIQLTICPHNSMSSWRAEAGSHFPFCSWSPAQYVTRSRLSIHYAEYLRTCNQVSGHPHLDVMPISSHSFMSFPTTLPPSPLLRPK